MQQNNNVLKLRGKIQHYAWGGHEYISRLLSIPNPENKPFAEYWLGAHDNAPSELVFEAPSASPGMTVSLTASLSQYIAEFPESTIGEKVNSQFGRLPYLLKILDVKELLSIQVHPSKKNAVLEFAAENKMGTPLNAPNRNYKDDNHKPELMLALSEFWLLHGFKPEDALQRILTSIPELKFLLPVFDGKNYKGLYQTVMEMPQAEVNSVLQPLLDRIIPLYKQDKLRKQDEDFWAARAALTYNEGTNIDRGIFSIYFFNVLQVFPGQAVFQDAGVPHAYMEGQNVEIMANSDNVLRGGLTPKHVDVQELLKHVQFEATHPHIITGDELPGHIAVYKTPAPDFELSRISLTRDESVTIHSRSVEIFIVLEGKAQVAENEGGSFIRSKGDSFVAFDDAKLTLRAEEDTIIFRASVPQA